MDHKVFVSFWEPMSMQGLHQKNKRTCLDPTEKDHAGEMVSTSYSHSSTWVFCELLPVGHKWFPAAHPFSHGRKQKNMQCESGLCHKRNKKSVPKRTPNITKTVAKEARDT